MTDDQFEKLAELLVPRFRRIDDQFETLAEMLARQFERIEARFRQIDGRFEQIDGRFEQIDARFEQIDGRFEALEERLRAVEVGQEALRGELRTVAEGLSARIEAVDRRLGMRLTTLEESVDRLDMTMLARFDDHGTRLKALEN